MSPRDRNALMVLIPALAAGAVLAWSAGNAFESSKVVYQANATAVNQSGNSTTSLGVVNDPGLNFGRVPLKTGSTKFLQLNAGERSIVEFASDGNISERLDHDSWMVVEGNREVNVRFESEQPGYYSGEFRIEIRTPGNRLGELWLELERLLRR